MPEHRARHVGVGARQLRQTRGQPPLLVPHPPLVHRLARADAGVDDDPPLLGQLVAGPAPMAAGVAPPTAPPTRAAGFGPTPAPTPEARSSRTARPPEGARDEHPSAANSPPSFGCVPPAPPSRTVSPGWIPDSARPEA